MKDIREIIELNPAKELALAERIHEAVVYLKKLRDSSFWNVQTFRVNDLGLVLDGEEMTCLAARIGLAFRVATEADVLSMNIDLPDGLHAGASEMYALSHCLNQFEHAPNAAPVTVHKLQLVTVKRRRSSRAGVESRLRATKGVVTRTKRRGR